MNVDISKMYFGNTLYIKRLFSDLTEEDMLLRTGNSNTIGWILAHIVYYRSEIANKLKLNCETEEFEKAFQRGAPKNFILKVDLSKALENLENRGKLIIEGIEKAGDAELRKKIDIVLPGGDGSFLGYLTFLAWHEAFHIGQIDLIKAAVGKGGIK